MADTKIHTPEERQKEPFLLKINDNLSIAVETSTDPTYPHELYVGIMDKNGIWLQDITVIRTPYAYVDGNPKFDEKHIELLSYEDADSEDYTRTVTIPIRKTAENN